MWVICCIQGHWIFGINKENHFTVLRRSSGGRRRRGKGITFTGLEIQKTPITLSPPPPPHPPQGTYDDELPMVGISCYLNRDKLENIDGLKVLFGNAYGPSFGFIRPGLELVWRSRKWPLA